MARPLVKSGTDPQQVRRAERTVEQITAQLLVALREVMTTPAGRFVLCTLLEDAHVYKTSFDHSGSVMYFTEGQRYVGLVWRDHILAADPAGYDLMQREARQRDRRLDTATAAMQDASPTAGGESDGSDD